MPGIGFKLFHSHEFSIMEPSQKAPFLAGSHLADTVGNYPRRRP